MGDVIDFPKKYDGPPKSAEDIAAEKAIAKERWTTEVSIDVTFEIVKMMEEIGVDMYRDPYMKYDLLMLNETLKALINRSQSVQHPFQRLSQDLIKERDADAFFQGLIQD